MAGDEQLGTLGRGTVVTLDRIEDVPVNFMRSDSPAPSVMVGPAINSPIGPSVIIGCNATFPDGPTICMGAHLSPSEAEELAAKLIEAAKTVRRAVQ